MISWMSRSFKKRLGAEALSSCHHQFDVSVPRRAMWQVHVVQHPNVAFGVDAHTLFDEARRENDAVHHGAHHGAWVALAVSVDAHIGMEICLSCGPPMGSNHPSRTVLRGSFQRKNFSSENTTRVRSKGFKCRLPGIESTPTRCSTSRQKFNRARRFSVVNRSARTGMKQRAWRSSCNARHNVERDMSSELCRRSTLRVCGHGHFNLGQHFHRSRPLQRT